MLHWWNPRDYIEKKSGIRMQVTAGGVQARTTVPGLLIDMCYNAWQVVWVTGGAGTSR